MIKRLLPILLLIIVIYNMAGVFVVFKYELAKVRKEIKHQIKNGIPEEELHFFSLTQREYEQLHWTREGKEFRYGEEMFDIVHRENVNGNIELRCVNDKEEKELFTNLDEMVRQAMDQDTDSPNNPINKTAKLFQQFNFFENTDYTIKPPTTGTLLSFREITTLYSSPFIEITTPPPDTV